MFDLIRSFPHS